jgi:divalent metal cation (Fe/Co/Zn/Cd) transporter
MVSISQSPKYNTLRRIQRIQMITIVWMSIEAVVSLSAAWKARSPALLAFGGDSAIELLSAMLVLWQFSARHENRHAETRAAQIAGGLLFVLAVYVTVLSIMTLWGHHEPKPTYLGIIILIAAAAVMPWLTHEKRKLSATTGSGALRADAAQSGLCAYLSLVALVGLAVNAIWHVPLADPAAALAITPLIVWEGKLAIRGNACRCCG